MKEIVIRIKISNDSPEEIAALGEILNEKKKPGWHTKISGWRTGQRALSERALSLMLEGVRFRESTVKENPSNATEKTMTKPVLEENPFG
jgi:hypothetical protein